MKSCAKHKEMLEELISSMVVEDTAIICDDEEKVAKTCAKFEPLTISGKYNGNLNSGPALSLFLVTTLGEPN
jgi:hypothetical protein